MDADDAEREIAGVFVAHWEVSRFVVDMGAGKRHELWRPNFPEDFEFPPSGADSRGPARFFRMKVRATVGPRGAFGHMGICTRELLVSRVISCEQTSDPGDTW